ncbi:NTP transferase domain-containing protein [Mycobacterium sp. CBMA293]|uniref:IspD/TarI family cytidylyltransferase n=1 Tax=unclassified Mycolicibacterium TaxID=2636767 RepID=UPI00132A007F|nr:MULTISPECIES: 2-C-methyl-D-erythritol 4-phosphate cytidylyltransferase [unclassified Mycolicibacterium]MUL48632.1 NTP transferase domain-containing protein [Mycolicibacterium sp. CBMA 360]MUL95811.1 NTP transferase domain-containing protein [Mycolicibacterium sp. CBMA 230]MUL60870.1 NTP transferase domain-containing protein [Mycolicibacterium sp. CBMA 335]MUL71883.1 NTP transferase domain-containing protein [Mycolicibacterium sp. CBMA 311]MUM06409.1 2-C-methyl-D-erythritol 4-phosphate cytid
MSAPPIAVGVVLAAGIGSRVGADGNKAYLQLSGRSMVAWSVAAVAASPEIARTILVFRRGEHDQVEQLMADELPDTTVEFVEGGDSRHGSEHNVLTYLAPDIEAGTVDVVLIHDAARPLAGPALMTAAVEAARAQGGAIPVLPSGDVLRMSADGLTAIDDALVRVQTPQAFRAAPLWQAYLDAAAAGFEGTDTSSCVERFTDIEVHAIAGSASNFKVTFAHDVQVAERLLSQR